MGFLQKLFGRKRLDIEKIKRNVWDIVPTAGGGYLTRRADKQPEGGAGHTGKTKQIPGFKILLVRPDSLQHLRRDGLLWPRVLNKDDIPTYSVQFFMERGHKILAGWDLLVRDGPKKAKDGLVIFQSDTPHFICDLLSGIRSAKESSLPPAAERAPRNDAPSAHANPPRSGKSWWQFWK